MKGGIEIPPAVIVVALIVVVAVIGLIGYKALIPRQRVQMSPEAIKGTQQHISGQGSGGRISAPGGVSAQHSTP